MSDLISRSQALDLLYKIFDKYKMSTDKNTSIGKSFGTDVFEEIKNMPTAYDIDKVVEGLEKATQYIKIDGKPTNVKAIHPEQAIEIVKQGGITDDMCEWKKGSSGYVGYPAYYSKCCTTNSNGLEMQTHIITDWKCCPYCGKKIKVVE